jgi:hypothetical protein
MPGIRPTSALLTVTFCAEPPIRLSPAGTVLDTLASTGWAVVLAAGPGAVLAEAPPAPTAAASPAAAGQAARK